MPDCFARRDGKIGGRIGDLERMRVEHPESHDVGLSFSQRNKPAYELDDFPQHGSAVYFRRGLRGLHGRSPRLPELSRVVHVKFTGVFGAVQSYKSQPGRNRRREQLVLERFTAAVRLDYGVNRGDIPK